MLNEERIKELLSQLPLPPDEDVPPGVSEAELVGFEERTGIPLPPELRIWLRISNAPLVGTQATYGIKTRSEGLDIEPCYGFIPQWKGLAWIPIGDDGSGNYYIVPTRQEFGPGFPVLFIDTGCNAPDVPTYIVASSVGRFVEFLMEKELGISEWPFDEAEVVARDPGILGFQGVDKPWEESA
jgi:hypothetical protein